MTENTERPPLPDHLSADPRSPHHVKAVCDRVDHLNPIGELLGT